MRYSWSSSSNTLLIQHALSTTPWTCNQRLPNGVRRVAACFAADSTMFLSIYIRSPKLYNVIHTLEPFPQADEPSRFDTCQARYLVLTVHTAHLYVNLVDAHTQAFCNVPLHVCKALFHAWLLSTQNGHIDRSQEKMFWFNQASAHLREILNGSYACFAFVRKPVINITFVDGCRQCHYNSMSNNISIATLGIRTFREGLKGDSCQSQLSSFG